MQIETELDKMINDYSIVVKEKENGLTRDIFKMMLQDLKKLKSLLPTQSTELSMPDVRRMCLNEVAYNWEMPNEGHFTKWLYEQIDEHCA